MHVPGELRDWAGHTPEEIRMMRDVLVDPKRRGRRVTYDRSEDPQPSGRSRSRWDATSSTMVVMLRSEVIREP